MAVPFKTRYDHYHYSFLDESLSFVIFWEQPEGAWRRSRNLFEYIVIFEIILKTIYCGATISFQFCWCCGERVASAWFVIAVAALGRRFRGDRPRGRGGAGRGATAQPTKVRSSLQRSDSVRQETSPPKFATHCNTCDFFKEHRKCCNVRRNVHILQ